jgi:hypothetical protein
VAAGALVTVAVLVLPYVAPAEVRRRDRPRLTRGAQVRSGDRPRETFRAG